MYQGILIQIGYIYMGGGGHSGFKSRLVQTDHLSHMDCDPDSNPDSGPGARVNMSIDNFFNQECMVWCSQGTELGMEI